MPVLSKVFERMILNQVKVYRQAWGVPIDTIRLSKRAIMYYVVIQINIQRDVTSSEVAIALFAGYSKAFDTIPYIC